MIFNVVKLVDPRMHLSPAQDFFGLFELQPWLHVLTFVLLLFNGKRMLQQKYQMGKPALFQTCNHLLYFIMGKFTHVFFEDGLCSLGTIAATFSRNGLAMLESCWVSTHMLMPAWRTEKPSLTSSLVCPFTSFDAGQSSRMMRVLLPSKQKLANLNQISTWCCIQMWVSLSEPVQHSVKGEGWTYQQDVVKLAIEWTAELVNEKLHLARVCRANN